ncbi:MAG TPA: CBS domain-containing protein [Candidatus Bilamarchaeum sp.]|nr:CBS domain-containing protein [Candidatus Bilamarchaeum sp.]
MEIKRTLVLDSSDYISKALSQLDETPAVIVTKNGKYFGVIDHRCLGNNMRIPQNTKCESAVIRPPVLPENAELMERVDAFLLGHFKALPVIDENDRPVGITTRVELLKEMAGEGLLPATGIADLMSSPAFTINDDETIGSAKRMMKEKKARRLVVTRNSNLVGVISAYDISVFTAKPNLFESGRKDIKNSQEINIDQLKISNFLRPDVTLVSEGEALESMVKRMIAKGVSHAIVVSGKKPVGVISALDVFRKVQEGAAEGLQIAISGVSEDDMDMYNYIKDKISTAIEKGSKSFNIRNLSVHVKKGKSAHVMNVYFDMDKGHVSIKEERKGLKETTDIVASEIVMVLRKKKDIKKLKPRVVHAR